MDIVIYLFYIFLAILLYITIWFLRGLYLKRLDVADEAWGLAQPYIVIVAIAISKSISIVSLFLLILTSVWGLRLFWHLYKRHKRSPEDRRYVEMKKNWVKYPRLKSYVFVFLLQGTLMFLLSLANTITIFHNSPSQFTLWLGILIWTFGFGFEYLADKQLASFIAKQENRGKIMTQGLWKYSRHPNYFGEVTIWWGIFVICFGQIQNPLILISPITITILIVFVSGIPLAEKSFKGRKDWEEYKLKTSPLIPWPNK